MALELFNTLSGKIEPLFASDGHALRFYCCGPTVYDYGHIGNFRTFLHVDMLRRTARLYGMGLHHVMNITDVDDKIIRNAGNAGLPIGEYTAKFERAFFEDMDALGVERPEQIARATENIGDMVTLIERLAAQDIAYKAEDGSWYFRIARFPEYGKLSKKDFEGIEDGARVDVDEYDKDAARDFALWKATKPGETSWDTALGKGRPGWHIECSAMAMKYLGDSFDLHAGGEDLMFPHHENEIAQSECATHQPFARHWFHVRFLLVEGKKMSKSEGNFYTLRDLLLKGHRASAIRFLLLSVPYRHQLNFTFDGLTESTNAVERLRTFYTRIRDGKWPESAPADDSVAAAIRLGDEKFTAALGNDLNTAEARAAIFDVLRAVNSAADQSKLTRTDADAMLALLAKFDSIFAVLEDHDAELTRAAIAWAESEGRLGEADASLLATLSLSDADIDALVAERTLAKKQRNFARADAVRNELLEKGILLEDSKDGVRWKRK
ncbi:cysteine--tRNA ligase [Granulicella mallensis]|uniref:Cysteine--tRNA ligase n=1 Tax=Granulicella mallensis TaxID=940614 RepID=A0A7W7ZTB2_9BACT|nr:cysteine--tRNA ligase [Granulicella mallensis]MBB5065413.1 cysteinyl-tRNA synthetase [Granulicella mallensis]